MSDHRKPIRWPRRWPLVLLALPAGVATWSGWVGLGEKTGFGPVKPLPGIADHFTINSAITLPIGVETFAAVAMAAWMTSAPVSDRTRRFARRSALAALVLGMTGQVAYHLMASGAHRFSSRWWVTIFVACLPVLVLGLAAGLAHMIDRDRSEHESGADTDPADATQSERTDLAAAVPAPPLAPIYARASAPAVRPADIDADTTPALSADTSAPADTDADTTADGPRLALAAPLVPAQPPTAARPTENRVSAPAPREGEAPRVSAPDTTEQQVNSPQRPPLSAPAASPAARPADAPADASAPVSARPAGKADKRADKPSVSAAVTMLMRQGITDADEITARVPEIVGHDVPRATVTRTLRRHRSATADTDTHTGNYL